MTDQLQRFIFGLLAVAGFLSLLGWLGYLLKTEGVTVENGPLLTLLTAMAGLLGGEVKGIYNFLFGSSSGSKEKTAMMKPPTTGE